MSSCVKFCKVVSRCVKLCQGVSSCIKLCQGVSSCVKLFQVVSKCVNRLLNIGILGSQNYLYLRYPLFGYPVFDFQVQVQFRSCSKLKIQKNMHLKMLFVKIQCRWTDPLKRSVGVLKQKMIWEFGTKNARILPFAR